MSLPGHVRITLRATGIGAFLAVCGAAPLAVRPALAQAADSDGDIRVVEFLDPESGARYRQAVYDLTKAEIQAVQRALRAAGYLGVGWTGQLDHGTVKALGEFQDDRGLYRCGCVSYETIVALGLKPAVQVVAVAAGGAGQPGEDPYWYHAGTHYPLAFPVIPPADSAHPPRPGDPDHPGDPAHPGDPDHPHREGGETALPAQPYPPPGATPPGVRPLPPPARAMPADPRAAAAPTPAP